MLEELTPDPLAELLAQAPPLGPWVEDAACAGLEAFTAELLREPNLVVLRKVCAGCPVRAACGTYADRSRSLGMWAGVFRSVAFYGRAEAA